MTTCRCGAEWTGKRLEHCTAPGCHQTFTGTEAGDRHRVGSFTDPANPRRCLTVEEMRDKGMAQNSRGAWSRGRADSRWVVVPQSDEQPPEVPAAIPGPDAADRRQAP